MSKRPTPEQVAYAIDLAPSGEWSPAAARASIARAIAADREWRAPGDGPAAVSVEQIRQVTTAVLGRLDLALDHLAAHERPSVAMDSITRDVQAAHEAAQQLADLCRRAVEQCAVKAAVPEDPPACTHPTVYDGTCQVCGYDYLAKGGAA